MPPDMTLEQVRDEMMQLAHEDQSPVVVDRLRFLGWVLSLDALVDGQTGDDAVMAPMGEEW
jgi:hypothetical protein